MHMAGYIYTVEETLIYKLSWLILHSINSQSYSESPFWLYHYMAGPKVHTHILVL